MDGSPVRRQFPSAWQNLSSSFAWASLMNAGSATGARQENRNRLSVYPAAVAVAFVASHGVHEESRLASEHACALHCS